MRARLPPRTLANHVEEEPSQVTAPEHAVDDAAPHASEDEDEDDYEDVDDFIRESLGEEEGR